MQVLERLGIKKQTNKDDGFAQSIFYFMKELHKYPLDEEYTIKIEWIKWFWKIKKPYIKIIKKGIYNPLFNSLLNQLQEHYKKENERMKRKR